MSDWRQYITIESTDEKFRQRVSDTLDDMWNTQEGAARIMKAYELRRSNAVDEKSVSRLLSHIAQDKEHSDPIIEHAAQEMLRNRSEKLRILKGEVLQSSTYDTITNTVIINMEDVGEYEHENTRYTMTLPRVLFHEISHAADRLLTVNFTNKIYECYFDNKEQIGIEVSEAIITAIENQYIEKYYGDPPHTYEDAYRYAPQDTLEEKRYPRMNGDIKTLAAAADLILQNGPLYGERTEWDDIRAQFVGETGCKPVKGRE